jgi:hypothetical protein
VDIAVFVFKLPAVSAAPFVVVATGGEAEYAAPYLFFATGGEAECAAAFFVAFYQRRGRV